MTSTGRHSAPPAVRVVSLVPSSTETLLALGADVVACTRFCERPDLPHVGGTKNPDIDAIVGLAPDVVVLDREENRREDADALAAAGCRLFVSDVRTVTDARTVVHQLADLVGVAAPATGEGGPTAGRHADRSAFVPIWRRPWMSINSDTYGASLLAQLGVELVTAEAPDPYPTVDLDELAPPDLVLVPSEPYDFGAAHLEELAAAFPDATILRIDGQDLFWWGIRTDAALTRLRARLGPPPTL